MNTADLANERVFAEIKRLCLMGLDPMTLRKRVTERLGRAVPYEA
jgi:DNA-binding CsgD family transcriptional regulator